MPGTNPVNKLVNIPVPVASVVLLSATVGFVDILQQTPRAETVAPPSLLILPPLVAEELEMYETGLVDKAGTEVDRTKSLKQRTEKPSLLL